MKISKISSITLLLLSFCLIACSEKVETKEKPETLIDSGYDQIEMENAISKAKATIDEFINILNKNSGSNHSVKIPISDNDQVEQFWITNIKYENNQFTGFIGNEPGIVRNVEIGQKVSVNKSEVSDWLYIKDKKMYGNFTMRPQLKNLPKEQAEAYRSMLANP